jgi:hypothetical protein
MPQGQVREPQSRKIEDARDLQAKLYREIGISAVAAALRFTTQPDSVVRVQGATAAGRGGPLAA